MQSLSFGSYILVMVLDVVHSVGVILSYGLSETLDSLLLQFFKLIYPLLRAGCTQPKIIKRILSFILADKKFILASFLTAREGEHISNLTSIIFKAVTPNE